MAAGVASIFPVEADFGAVLWVVAFTVGLASCIFPSANTSGLAVAVTAVAVTAGVAIAGVAAAGAATAGLAASTALVAPVAAGVSAKATVVTAAARARAMMFLNMWVS